MFPSFTSRDVLLWFQVLHDFLLLLVTIPTLLLNEASSFDEQCHRTGQMLYSFCWVFACRHLHYILYLQKLSKVWFYTLKWRLCNVVRDRERVAKLRAIQTHMHLQMCCPRTTYKCQWPLDASTCSQVMLPTCGLQALFLLLVGFVVGWFCCRSLASTVGWSKWGSLINPTTRCSNMAHKVNNSLLSIDTAPIDRMARRTSWN